MTLRSTSTTVLIIPLILSMLSPRRTRAVTSAAEIGYFSADQKPYGNLSDSSPTGYLLPSISRIQKSTIPLGIIIITATTSTISPLPLVKSSFRRNLLASHRGICTPQNMSTPWTRKPIPFATDESRDDNIVLLLEIQPRQTYDHPLEPTYDFCTSYSINSPQFQSHDPWVGPLGLTPEADVYSFSMCYFFGYIDVNHTNIQKFVSSRRSLTQRTGFSYSLPRKMLLAKDSTTDGNLHHRPRVLMHRKHQKILTKAAIATSSALLGLLCSILSLLLWCKRSRPEIVERLQRTELCPSAPRRYSRGELAAATQGFADGEKIGRGGFGPVYRGYLGDLNRSVAMKVLSQGSSVQGIKEFEAEVKVMTRLRHRNIVELIGWCDGPRDLLLVYELVPNGSLDKHLYDPQRVLTWPDRYKIALGLGSAILYLHTECEQCVVHGDIKPANVMLDASSNAKLGDFGLGRFIDHEADPRTTQVVAGTLGYIDPEFVNSWRPSAESDVYSFGVVLLEIACGRRPTSTQSNGTAALVNWVREMYSQNSILEAADRRLDGEFDEQQLKRMVVTGLWCARHDQSQRPSIANAMDVLRREDAELPVFDPEMHVADALRSLEERAYGDLSREDSSSEESPAETEYHSSTESTYQLPQK